MKEIKDYTLEEVANYCEEQHKKSTSPLRCSIDCPFDEICLWCWEERPKDWRSMLYEERSIK